MRTIINILILLSISSLAFAQFAPGVIGNDQSICYQSAPLRLTFTTQPSGGTLPYSYRWQRSNDGGATWIDISGTSAALPYYSPPVLGRTTRFRCSVHDATTPTALTEYTNTVTINVTANLTAGTIGGAQTIYSGTPPSALVETEAPTGGSGSYSYRWQSSTNGQNWSDITGANSAGYAPHEMTTDTWFRRWVIDGSCGSTASNSVHITVNAITLYTSEVPAFYPSWAVFDWGTEFRVLTDGFITRVRLFTGESEIGLHTVRLWMDNGSGYRLIAGPFTWDILTGVAGWREFNLVSAVAVSANRNYIVSITNNNPVDRYWAQRNSFIPATNNNYLTYLRGIFAATPGNIPNEAPSGESYFRDIVFVPFTGGSAGVSQTICYNTAPAVLSQITPPTGASGTYTFQWQSSPDNLIWSYIQGATSSDYLPPALNANTYYRRVVTSGNLTAYCPPVLITVNNPFGSVQLQGNITIYENTSTFINVSITGGTPPYTIEYTRNNVPQNPISNYNSGDGIFTGVLSSGTYTYSLTSVTDAIGCAPQSLGNPISVTASGSYSGSESNNALVIVNSTAGAYYPNYYDYIKPYLDWFGIPYETCDISAMPLPEFSDYAVIIFGHRAVYSNSYPEGQRNYPITALETAINAGVGLYCFDPQLFDVASGFNIPGELHPDFYANRIDILPNHYITQNHANDIYNPTNNTINLKLFSDPLPIHIWQHSHDLVGSTSLATMTTNGTTEPLLEVANYGNGRIVKWGSYQWVFDEVLGPVYGMDDLIWRGIVWAARKPFVMQGIPPMITLRVDDVDGAGGALENDLEWLKISNEYGFIPWCGTFINTIPPLTVATLRNLINNNLTTASPHSFSTDEYIYYDLEGDPDVSPAANVIAARNFYAENGLSMSKYIVPHAYLMSSEAVTEVRNMGIEFVGTPLPLDQSNPESWAFCGPYRINRPGYPFGQDPVYYGGIVNWQGINFFNSLTEIRDDGNYEWYPTDDVGSTTARGIRHLRRALNSMVLPALFTHEYHLRNMSPSTWRLILDGVTTAMVPYNPEYRSMDYAVQYIRAKENINITNVTEDINIINISCSGVNDMETKCYIFTESNNLISTRLITLPQVNSNSVPVTVGVLK